MGAGAASTEAARAMVARNEVYMLADMRAKVEREELERKTGWLLMLLLGRVVSDGVPDSVLISSSVVLLGVLTSSSSMDYCNVV